jgi:hypothetical protein
MCFVNQADCSGRRCQLSISGCQGFTRVTGADYLRHPRVCHGWGLMSYGTFRHSVRVDSCQHPLHHLSGKATFTHYSI